MTSENNSVRWIIALGVLVFAANLAAQSPLLLVVNKNENALAIVDVASKKVLGRVPTGEGPHEVAASSDGKLAFVSNYGLQNGAVNPGRTISVIDIAARKELRKLDLGAVSRPHGLVFAGGKLYFTAEGHKLIGTYDPASNQVDWRLGIGQNRTHMVILTKDRNRMFTSNIESDSITAIERVPEPIGWNETVIPVGKGPEAIDISPDEKEVWTAHGGDGAVSVIDAAAKKVIQTIPLQMVRSNRLKITLDGKRVFISDARGNRLLVLDRATRKEIKRMDIGKAPQGIQMAPDGVHAYVAANGDDKIVILDVNTLQVTGEISPGSGPDGLAWVGK